MKKIVLFFTLLLWGGFTAWTQPQQANPGFKELRQYFAQNIKPELMKQQARFMSVLTEKEKNELKTIKQNWKKVREQMHGKVSPENRSNTQKAHYSAFHSQVEAIVNAHPKEKKAYEEAIRSKKEQWNKDIAAIREKYQLPKKTHTDKFLERIEDPAFILIWNPNKPLKAGKKSKNHPIKKKPNHQQVKKAVNDPGIKIFPQPAYQTVSIRITGTKGKKINAGIYDSNGKKIQSLFNAKSSMPFLNFSVDVSNWKEGFYVVKVQFDNRTMTYDFEVKKK